MAQAIRDNTVVTLRARSREPHRIRPVRLSLHPDGWVVAARDAPEQDIPLRMWGDINISRVDDAAGV